MADLIKNVFGSDSDDDSDSEDNADAVKLAFDDAVKAKGKAVEADDVDDDEDDAKKKPLSHNRKALEDPSDDEVEEKEKEDLGEEGEEGEEGEPKFKSSLEDLGDEDDDDLPAKKAPARPTGRGDTRRAQNCFLSRIRAKPNSSAPLAASKGISLSVPGPGPSPLSLPNSSSNDHTSHPTRLLTSHTLHICNRISSPCKLLKTD